MTSVQIVISSTGILVVLGVLLKIMLSDRDKRIDKNEESISKIKSDMATKYDLSEMKGDIKLILNHILGAKNEN
jgi:hypothetical protein